MDAVVGPVRVAAGSHAIVRRGPRSARSAASANAVEFALAVSLLGVNRGLTGFVRYAFLKRNGLAFLATPLGRVPVTPRPAACLVADPKLTVGSTGCGQQAATRTRRRRGTRQLSGRSTGPCTSSVLVASPVAIQPTGGHSSPCCAPWDLRSGRSARGMKFCEDNYIRPLQDLSAQWLDQASDDSAEFRLAASIAGIRGDGKVGSLRVYSWSRVGREGRVLRLGRDKNKSAVWSNRPLRSTSPRSSDADRWKHSVTGQSGTPLNSPCPARITDVIAFLDGETDDDKLADLLWARSPSIGRGSMRTTRGSHSRMAFHLSTGYPDCWSSRVRLHPPTAVGHWLLPAV